MVNGNVEWYSMLYGNCIFYVQNKQGEQFWFNDFDHRSLALYRSRIANSI